MRPTNGPLRRILAGSGARVLILPPALILAVGVLVPLIAVIIETVSEYGPVGTVTEPITSGEFLAALGRTLLMSVEVMVLTLIVGLLYSLALGLAPPVLSKLLFGILFLTFWISLLVRTYGWVLVLQPAGALDTVGQWVGLTGDQGFGLFQTELGLLPPMIHIMLPYMVLPIYAALRGIDPSQLRAARSLGASEWLVLRRIVLPGLKSGALAGSVLVFILALGFYVTPAFLGGPGQQVISIVIGREFGRLQNIAMASAMGVMLLAIVLVLYFVADRVLRISEQWENF